jgi:hypothetical protein
MLKKAINNKNSFGVVMLKKGSEVRQPSVTEELMPVGTIAEITEINNLQPSLTLIRCLGKNRFRLLRQEKVKYGLWQGEIEIIEDDIPQKIPLSLQPVANSLGKLISSMQKSGLAKNKMPILPPFRLEESGWVSNRWAELLSLNVTTKQQLLAEMCPDTRLKNIAIFLSSSVGNNKC